MTVTNHFKSNLRDTFFNLFEVLDIGTTTLGKAPFTNMDVDAVRETCRRVRTQLAETHRIHRRLIRTRRSGEPRNASSARDRNPDLMRKLRSDAVKAERRNEGNDRVRNRARRDHQAAVQKSARRQDDSFGLVFFDPAVHLGPHQRVPVCPLLPFGSAFQCGLPLLRRLLP